MSETSAKAPDYSEFVLRRLHSLSGVVPLSAFICFHFFANAFSTTGADGFNRVVDGLRSLPFLIAIEWGALFAPFLFHMFYGLWVIYRGQSNVGREPYPRNFSYVAQRVTALIMFVFIIYHVISMKYMVLPEDRFPHGADYYAALREHFRNPYIYWWYVVAVAATVFHLANGICTFCMTWGITIGRNSQRVVAGAMAGAGVVLFAIAIASLNGFLVDKKPHGAPAVAHNTAAPPAAQPPAATQ